MDTALLHELLRYHHRNNPNTENTVHTIYDKTDFHKGTLRFYFHIRDNGENSAEDHKSCITWDHDVRIVQRPLKVDPEWQNRPRNQDHNGTNYG